MFLVGDAPPHMDYAQDVKYPEVMRMARERDIVVNALQAGGPLAVIETPYDVEIIELQGRINGTVIPYGPRQQRDSFDRAVEETLRAQIKR